jgi:hypothetical protein
MQDHAMRMLRAFQTAATSSTVRPSCHRAGFLYRKNKNETYVLYFDEAHVRGSPEFREVWDINVPLQSLTARGQHSRWGSLNGPAIADSITAIFHLSMLTPLPFTLVNTLVLRWEKKPRGNPFGAQADSFVLGEVRSLGFTVDVLLFHQSGIFGVSAFIAILHRVQGDAKICVLQLRDIHGR